MRILCFGDSETLGAHDGLSTPTAMGGYRGHLVNGLNASGYPSVLVGTILDAFGAHDGHNGWRINDARAAAASILTTTMPNVIPLTFGTNDLLRPEVTPETRAAAPGRLGRLLEDIRLTTPGATVLVSTIPTVSAPQHCPPNQEGPTWVVEFNTALPAIVDAARETGQQVRLVNAFGSLTAAQLSDGIHPSDLGYQAVSVAFYQTIINLPFMGLSA